MKERKLLLRKNVYCIQKEIDIQHFQGLDMVLCHKANFLTDALICQLLTALLHYIQYIFGETTRNNVNHMVILSLIFQCNLVDVWSL